MSSPRFIRASEEAEKRHVELFGADLRRIAIRIAHHDKATVVDEPHVDAAFSVLKRFGLERQRLWARPEFEITVGVTLVGVSFNLPDLLPVFVPADVLAKAGVTISAVVGSFVLGALIWGHGWFRVLYPK